MRDLNYQQFKKLISIILLVSIVATSNGFVTFSQSINLDETVTNDIESPFLIQKTKVAGGYYKQLQENFSSKTSLLYNNVEEVEEDIEEEELETKVRPKTSHDYLGANEDNSGIGDDLSEPEDGTSRGERLSEPEDNTSSGERLSEPEDNTSRGERLSEPELEEEEPEDNTNNGERSSESEDDTSSGESLLESEDATSRGERSSEPELEEEEPEDNTNSGERSSESEDDTSSGESLLESEDATSRGERSSEPALNTEVESTVASDNTSTPSTIEEENLQTETDAFIQDDIATISEIVEDLASISIVPHKNFKNSIYYGEGEEEPHIHKICGISSESTCRHRLVAAHDNYIQYKATISSLDDLETMTGGTYFLDRDLEYVTAIGSVTYLQLTPIDDIYLCLNGNMLKNVVFLASDYTVTITNCQKKVATWINKDSTHSCMSNMDIFGVGENLVFETSLLYKSSGNAKTINAYSTTFTNYYDDVNVSANAYVQAAGDATFEVCTMSEAAKAKHMILANANLITFNCYFYKNSTADSLVNKTGTGAWQLLGDNKFESNTWGTSAASALVYVNGGSVVLPEDTVTSFHGNKNTNISSSLFKVNAARFDLRERAVLDISYNDMTKNSDGWSSFLRVMGTNCEFYSYGELHIRNNRITNCISSYNTNNISGINTAATIHIIEDSIIQVEGNQAVDNNGKAANYNTYKTFYFYDIYGGANPLFTRDTDYVFDKTSIVAELSMYTSGAASGTIMQNYTAETVKDFDYFSYLTDFNICTFDTRANACPYLDLATNEMKIIINSHQHKVCGQDKNTDCTHVKTAAHSTSKPYNDYNHVKDATEMSKGWWYLSANLSSTTQKVIIMETDVWLCLNGKTLTNYVFRNAEGNNFKVYISSCSASGTMANSTTSSDNYMLSGDEEIYGMDIVTTSKTATYFVNLQANYIYKNRNTTDRMIFYLCNFKNYNTSATNNTLVDIDGNNNIIFEIIKSDGANGGGKIISLKNVTMTFYSLIFMNVSNIRDSYLYLDNAKITFNGPLSISSCKYSESADLNGLIKLVNGSTFTSASISIKVRTVSDGKVVTNTETLNVSYSFTSNTSSYIGSMLSVSDDSSFTLDASTTFVVESNTLNRNKNGLNALLYLDNNKISIKGSISIKSNNVTGCNAAASADTGICTAVYMAENGVLNIGSGVVSIQSNTTNGNQATNPSYHMYQVYSKNTNGFIAQSAGTTFNVDSSYIVAYAEPYADAIIYKNYNSSTVVNFSPTSFIGRIVADKFNPTDLDVVRDVNTHLILQSGLHRHKVCGVDEATTCLHTEVAAHNSLLAYTMIPSLSADYDVNKFVATIEGGGVYYLSDDIVNPTTAVKTITINYPVYICLNGHNLEGFRFGRKDAACVYITNCQTDKSTIYNKYNAVTFLLPAQIYGVNGNMLIKADGVASSYTGQSYGFSVYDVEFEAGLDSGLVTTSTGMFDVQKGLTFRLEKCVIHSMKNGRVLFLREQSYAVLNEVEIRDANTLTSNAILVTYKSELYIKSNINIINNKYSNDPLIQCYGGGYLNIESSCVFTVEGNRGNSDLFDVGTSTSNPTTFNFSKGSVTTIQHNIINKANKRQSFFHTLTSINIFGTFTLTDNSIYNCTSSLNSGILSAFHINNTSAVIYLMNTNINIKDNYSYIDEGVNRTDDSRYAYHHVYQLYTINTNSILEQSMKDTNGDGKVDAVVEKWDPRNSYMVVAVVAPSTGIVYRDWSSASIQSFTEDLYQSVFLADSFIASDYSVKLSSSRKSVILDFEHDTHMHKICGVASGSECLHTLVAPHDNPSDVVQFAAASDFQAVAADTVTRISQGGNFYLREDLNLGSLTALTLRADLNLCLNGHIIKNLYIANTTYVLNVTSCVTNVVSTITSVTSAGTPFNQSNINFYGQNKNLKLVSRRITGAGTNMRNFTAYSTTFAFEGTDTNVSNAVLYNTDTLDLEDCDFSGYKYNAAFANNADYVNIKNCSFENMTCYANMFDSSYDTATPTFNLYGNNYIKNTTVGMSVFYDNKGANLIINEGILDITGTNATGATSKTNHGIIAFDNENSIFSLDVNAKLNLINSSITRVGSDQAVLYTTMKNLDLYGELNIVNNDFINCISTNASGHIAGFFAANEETLINVASRSIVIRDNISDADDLLYPNHHIYQMLAANISSSYRTDTLFKPTDGALFKATASFINLSFLNEPYTGLVFENFDEDHIYNYHNVDINDVFVADQFKNTLLFAIESGTEVVIRDDAVHSHKVCGLSTQHPCTHIINEGEPDRNKAYIYQELPTDPMIAIATMSEGGNFYLTDDLEFSEVATISIAADVLLCLNGYNLKNLVFVESDYTVYITNCQATVNTITNDTEEYLFKSNVYVYGKKSDYINLEIKSDHIYKGHSSLKRSYMYNIDIMPYDTNKQVKSVYDVPAGARLLMEDVDIKNFNNSDNLILNNGYLLLYGDINIHNNVIDGNIIKNTSLATFVSGNLNINDNEVKNALIDNEFMLSTEKSDINIKNNTVEADSIIKYKNSSSVIIASPTTVTITSNNIKKSTSSQVIYDIRTNNHKLLGDLIIKDNKFINCDAVSSDGIIAALYIREGIELCLGDTTITIDNNTSDSTDKLATSSYAFQIFSMNSNGFMRQEPGTKFVALDSLMTVGFGRLGHTGIIYKDFTDENVADIEHVAYYTTFLSDKFFDEREGLILNVKMSADKKDVIIREPDKNFDHYHKVCGVYTDEECLHTEKESHTEGYVYEELSSTLADSKYQEIFSAGGYYYLTDNTTMASDLQITVNNDLYLCLNGFNLSYVYFNTSKTNVNLYITNCKTTVSTLTNKAVGDVYGKSNPDIRLFDYLPNVEVYGKSKNLKIVSNYLYRGNSSYVCDAFIYDVNMTCYDATKSYNTATTQSLGEGYDSWRARFLIYNSDFTLEKVDIDKLSGGSHAFFYATSNVKKGPLKIKNCNFTNWDSFGYQPFFFQSGGGNVYFIGDNYINNLTNITARNWSGTRTNAGGAASGNGNQLLMSWVPIVVKGGTTEFNNIGTRRIGRHFINMKAGDFTVEEDGTFYMHNVSQLKNHIDLASGFFYTVANIYAYGSFKITGVNFPASGGGLGYNGKPVSAGAGGGYTLALAGSNSKLYVGNHPVQVEMSSYAKNSNYRANQDTGVYGILSANTNNPIVQLPNTKLNLESKLPLVFNSGNYSVPNAGKAGKVYGTFDKDHVQNFSENAWLSVFKPYTYYYYRTTSGYRYDNSSNYLLRKGAQVSFEAKSQSHYLCGGSSAHSGHTEIPTSLDSSKISYTGLDPTLTTEQTMTKIAAGGSWHLSKPIGDNDVRAIQINGTLNLCLNGFNLNNFTFSGTGAINICNCQTNLNSNIVLSNLQTPLFRNEAQTSIFSVNGNLDVYTNRFIEKNAGNLYLYGVNPHTYTKNYDDADFSYIYLPKIDERHAIILEKVHFASFSSLGRIMEFGNDAKTKPTTTIKFSEVQIEDVKDYKYNIFKSSELISFTGECFIKNCQKYKYEDSHAVADYPLLGISGEVAINSGGALKVMDSKIGTSDVVNMANIRRLSVAVGANFSITNNIITRSNREITSIIRIGGNKNYILGSMAISNNYFTGCTSANNVGTIAALYIEDGGLITLGDEFMNITKNTSNMTATIATINEVTGEFNYEPPEGVIDERTYQNHHVFDIYSNNRTGIFTQYKDPATGKQTKFNPLSSMKVAFSAPYTGIMFKDWLPQTVDYLKVASEWDEELYKNVFKADGFGQDLKTGNKRVRRALRILMSENMRDVLLDTEHLHMICGAPTFASCSHAQKNTDVIHMDTLIFEQVNYFASEKVAKSLSLEGEPGPAGRSLLRNIGTEDGIGYVYLHHDLYLCLNGYTMTNVVFKSADNKPKIVYVTNCKQEKRGGIRTVFESQMFDDAISVFFWGNNKNIRLAANEILHITEDVNTWFTDVVFANDKVFGTDKDAIIIDNAEITFYNCALDGMQSSRDAIRIRNGGKATFETFYASASIVGRSLFNVENGELTINGAEGDLNICTISNATFSNTSRGSIFAVGKEGKINFNCEVLITKPYSYLSDHMIHNEGTMLMENQNNSFAIYDGQMNKTIASQSFLYFAGEQTFYGDLVVKNSKYINCDTDVPGTILAGMHMGSSTAVLQLADAEYYINGIKAYADDGEVLVDDETNRSLHVFQVYSENTNFFLKQKEGTMFDAMRASMSVAFRHPGTGKIIANWDEYTVKDFFDMRFKDAFSADQFNDQELYCQYDDDGKFVMIGYRHYHKICGELENCTHIGIASHSDAVYFDKLTQRDMDDIANVIQRGRFRYLIQDIDARYLSRLTDVTLNEDLYLCLNGYNITNMRFIPSNFKLYITNCSHTNSEITVSDGAFVRNIDTEIYAKATKSAIEGESKDTVAGDRNIKIIAPTVVTFDTTSKKHFYAGNIEYENYNGKTSDAVFNIKNAAHDATLENIVVFAQNNTGTTTDFIKLDNENAEMNIYKIAALSYTNYRERLININNGKMVFHGDNAFVDCVNAGSNTSTNPLNKREFIYQANGEFNLATGSIIISGCKTDASDIFKNNGGKLITAENTNFIIKNNIIKAANNTSLKFLYLNSDNAFYGNVEVSYNKFVGATGRAGHSESYNMSGIGVGDNVTFNIGHGTIIATANEVYKNSEGTAGEENTDLHVFQVLSFSKNAGPIFAQLENTKFNTTNRLCVGFIKAYYTGTIIKQWNRNTMDHYRPLMYEVVFSPDLWFNIDLITTLSKDGQDVVIGYLHEHKICGVDGSTKCTHTLQNPHDRVVGYKALPPRLTSEELVELLNAGGRFYLHSLEDTDVTRVVKPSRDLYICLNGNTLPNIKFEESPYAVYITNCITDVEKAISDRGHSLDLDGASITNKSDDYMFYNNLYVYGQELVSGTTKKGKFNINLKSNLINNSGNTHGQYLYIYNADVYGYDPSLDTQDRDMFRNNESYRWVFENVNITNVNNVNNIYTATNDSTNIFETVNIKNNNIKGTAVDIAESSSYRFDNLSLTYNNTEQNLISVAGSPDGNVNNLVMQYNNVGDDLLYINRATISFVPDIEIMHNKANNKIMEVVESEIRFDGVFRLNNNRANDDMINIYTSNLILNKDIYINNNYTEHNLFNVNDSIVDFNSKTQIVDNAASENLFKSNDGSFDFNANTDLMRNIATMSIADVYMGGITFAKTTNIVDNRANDLFKVLDAAFVSEEEFTVYRNIVDNDLFNFDTVAYFSYNSFYITNNIAAKNLFNVSDSMFSIDGNNYIRENRASASIIYLLDSNFVHYGILGIQDNIASENIFYADNTDVDINTTFLLTNNESQYYSMHAQGDYFNMSANMNINSNKSANIFEIKDSEAIMAGVLNINSNEANSHMIRVDNIVATISCSVTANYNKVYKGSLMTNDNSEILFTGLFTISENNAAEILFDNIASNIQFEDDIVMNKNTIGGRFINIEDTEFTLNSVLNINNNKMDDELFFIKDSILTLNDNVNLASNIVKADVFNIDNSKLYANSPTFSVNSNEAAGRLFIVDNNSVIDMSSDTTNMNDNKVTSSILEIIGSSVVEFYNTANITGNISGDTTINVLDGKIKLADDTYINSNVSSAYIIYIANDDFDFAQNLTMNNNTFATASVAEMIYVANDLSFTGDTININENINGEYANTSFIYMGGDVFTVDVNTLNINGNKIYRNENNIQKFINIEKLDAEIKFLGESAISISDNKVDALTASNSEILAMFYIGENQKIETENVSIKIKNNNSIGIESNNNHLYGIYTLNSDGFIEQVVNTKFDATNNKSAIENIAFNTAEGTGIIYKHWNADNVNGYSKLIHRTVFVADTINNQELYSKREDDNAVITWFERYVIEYRPGEGTDEEGNVHIGTGSVADTDGIVEFDSKITGQTYYAEGCEFDGWGLATNSGAAFLPSGLYNLDDYVEGGKVILYGQYSPRKSVYNVTFYSNNEKAINMEGKTVMSIVVLADDPFEAYTEFYLDGYMLSKYNTKSDGTGVEYLLDKSYYNRTGNDIVLYAVWDKVVSGNGGGGGGGSASNKGSVGNYVTGEMLPLSSTLPTYLINSDTISGSWEYDPVSGTWRYVTDRTLYEKNKIYIDNLYSFDTSIESMNLGVLKSGLYRLGLEKYYYYFDRYGNMMTGFFNFYGDTYYAEEAGIYKGAIVRGNKLIDGVEYQFSPYGALIIPEDEIYTVVSGVWYYDPIENKWGYAVKGANNKYKYLRKGMYRIKDRDGLYKLFYVDIDGNFVKGKVFHANKYWTV